MQGFKNGINACPGGDRVTVSSYMKQALKDSYTKHSLVQLKG